MNKSKPAANTTDNSCSSLLSSIVVHYSEIGLKGKNRVNFEKKLVENIKKVVDGEVKRFQGRMLVETDNMKSALKVLGNVFGIANFSPAVSCKSDMKDIRKTALKIMKGRKGPFKVDARRAHKKFPKTSMEINNVLGDKIVEKYGLEVDLDRPETVVYVEVLKDITLLYLDKFPGPGGLPVGIAGRVVSLLSGGIDSPVSTWMIMKRGCEVKLVHFYNESMGSYKKIKKIARVLSKWQPGLELIAVPFQEIQNKLISEIPAKWRIIIYRRMMLRIAQNIARKEGAKALVTGNSLSQVSSQTLDNMAVIEESADLSVFNPLIGFNKQEIVNLAKRIKTYEISILPYQDCCSFMVAKHPVTRANLEKVESLEKNLNITKMVKSATSGKEEVKI